MEISKSLTKKDSFGENPRKILKRSSTEEVVNKFASEKLTGLQKQLTLGKYFTKSEKKVAAALSEKAIITRGSTEIMEEEIEETKSVDSDISYNSNKVRDPIISEEYLKDKVNLRFYLNLMKSEPDGDFIDVIQRTWRFNFDKLEIHHGYVQWLFPNFYGSAFNGKAAKLGSEEAKIFRENIEISKRLVKSYEMMYNFYGMKIVNKQTGEVARSDKYEERYHKTLITSLHNHLRIRRILTHMNVVGFRKYAIELVKFFETEIYGSEGYKQFLSQPKPLKGDYIRRMKNNPLYPLVQYDVFKIWKMYGEVHTKDEKDELHKNCFTTNEKDYEESIYFKSNL
jgi:hypothetical protein